MTRTPSRLRTFRIEATVLGVLGVLAAAPVAGSQVPRRTPSSPPPAGRERSPSARGHANVVTVTTHDFAFEMPDSIPAGLTTFRMHNSGTQPHHLMMYRLEGGKSLSDVFAALNARRAYPTWMHPAGGPNWVPHDGQSVGTVDLRPGTYVAFCRIPGPDRVPHFAKGMMRMIVVTPGSEPRSSPPPTDLVVTLREYDFTLSRAPRRGPQTITVINRGSQTHELILAKLKTGKTVQDWKRWTETQEGAPPLEPSGGTTDLAPGGEARIRVNLTPGTYGVRCRVRDAKDDRQHDLHGMIDQFVVR